MLTGDKPDSGGERWHGPGGDAVALSMEEQRILAEIERNFTRADPGLAARLTRFGGPGGLAGLVRSPRQRVLASITALALLLLMSVLVYLVVSLRGMPQRGTRPAAAPQHRVSAAPRSAPVRSRATVAAGTPRARRGTGGPARTRR
jgi:Protein of unknown function (DUF3040)